MSGNYSASIFLHIITLTKYDCNLYPTRPNFMFFNWAISNQRKSSFNFATIIAPRSWSAVLKEVGNVLSITMDEFKPQWIPWEPNDVLTQIYVHPFKKALHSLLQKPNLVKHGNFSFPDTWTCHLCKSFPSPSTILKLHHGKWWAKSWNSLCNAEPNSKEILVPVNCTWTGLILINKESSCLHLWTWPLEFSILQHADFWKLERHYIFIQLPITWTRERTRNNKLNGREANLANISAGLAEALKSIKNHVTTCF